MLPRGTRTAKIYSKILYLFNKFTVYYPRPELEGGRTFCECFTKQNKVVLKFTLIFRRNDRSSGCDMCFDDHNFINNHPPDLKLVSNDAPYDLLQSALKFRL